MVSTTIEDKTFNHQLFVEYSSNERMIEMRALKTQMKQRIVTGRSCSSTSASTVLIAILLAGLSSIQMISSCVISSSESVAIVGDLILFSCNARPNSQNEGSIASIKLGRDATSGIDVFVPPAYTPSGDIYREQYLAEGYFLSRLDDDHINVTIQINKTQLKHGGQYFCICTVGSTSTQGTENFTVIDKLSFVRSGDETLTPGAMVDLNCSVSFNGSTSNAFIDLTLSYANGTQVSAAKNLSLISNVTGHHSINYKVIADPKEEQRFTCELKVWNKSSTEESLLRSMESNLSLNWGRHPHVTTSPYHSTTSPAKGRAAFIAVGVIAVLLVVAVLIVISIGLYKACHTRNATNRIVIAQSVGQRSTSNNQNIRYKDVKPATQHPSHTMPQYPEDKGHRNKAMADNDVFVVENDIYEASSGNNPADFYKTEPAEQIYNQIL